MSLESFKEKYLEITQGDNFYACKLSAMVFLDKEAVDLKRDMLYIRSRLLRMNEGLNKKILDALTELEKED